MHSIAVYMFNIPASSWDNFKTSFSEPCGLSLAIIGRFRLRVGERAIVVTFRNFSLKTKGKGKARNLMLSARFTQ